MRSRATSIQVVFWPGSDGEASNSLSSIIACVRVASQLEGAHWQANCVKHGMVGSVLGGQA